MTERATGDAKDRLEADRLPGFAHPREVSVVIGHEDAQMQMLDAFRSGRLHHGWLIRGPEGIGKATLAYRFARFLLSRTGGKEDNSGDVRTGLQSKIFAQVAALSHPNLLVLRRPWQAKRDRFAQSITIDEVRGLRSFLGNTAGNPGWRVIIVDRAEDLNLNAANALLKSLEEPPPRCIFLLISSSSGKLPLTVRSRCCSLRLAPLNDGDLEQAVRAALASAGQAEPEDELLKFCAQLADGSVARTLQLITHDGLALYDSILAVIESLPKLDGRSLHKLVDTVTGRGAEARLDLAFTLLDGILMRLIRHAATGEGAIGKEAKLADALIRPASLARWTQLWETLQRMSAETLALNLDRKSFILGTFFRLEEVAHL